MTQSDVPQDIRPSPIAGRWYPSDPRRLARSIDDFIAHADPPPINGRLVGILAPHAGHQFSGPVAGYAFKAVQGMSIDTVAVIGPSHYPYYASALTTEHEAFETPLGLIPVDHGLIAQLRDTVPVTPVRDDQEHAIEIELPFLQRVIEDFSLVPLALLDQSLTAARQLGNRLAELLADRKALLVASSDLSHFYPQALAHQLDQEILEAINAFDPAAVIAAEADGRKIACGHGAIAATMIAAQQLGADTAKVVHYATSGDISHDYQRVVGYAAALFYQSATN